MSSPQPRPAWLGRSFRVVLTCALTLGACGRIGFERIEDDVADDSGAGDATQTDDGPDAATPDASIDGGARCADVWCFRRRLTFDNRSQVSDLTDFPVLVVLTESVNIDYTKVRGAGQDLRFTDSDGVTSLDHEIETWDANGTSYVWVKVPQVDGASDTDHIYMYYGRPTASDGQNASGVWSNGYVHVNHMAPALGDSSGNAVVATDNGTADTVGKVGRAREYDGASSYINYEPNGMSEASGTVLLWASLTDIGGITYAFSHHSFAAVRDNRVYLRTVADRQTLFSSLGDQGAIDSGFDLVLGEWHMLSLGWDGTRSYVYVDGSPTPNPGEPYTYAGGIAPFYTTGKYSHGTEYWYGRIDELRVSNVLRSADWIAAQHRSMEDAFITYGDEEDVSADL
jgi:hypothetical protein